MKCLCKNVQLPNNRLQAVQPLHGLKKKLQGDLKYWLHQLQVWNYRRGICPKGERWTTSSSKEGKVCHLTHHGSLSPAKTKQHPCSMWLLSWLLGWIAQWSPVTRARPTSRPTSPRCSNFALKRTAEDNELYHFHNQPKIRAYSISTPRCVCYESDAFERKIELMEKPCTCRGILATTSSIFDLLGLIATVVLFGKQIPQEICHGRSWD